MGYKIDVEKYESLKTIKLKSAPSVMHQIMELFDELKIDNFDAKFVLIDRDNYDRLMIEQSTLTNSFHMPNEISGVQIVIAGNGFKGIQAVPIAKETMMYFK